MSDSRNQSWAVWGVLSANTSPSHWTAVKKQAPLSCRTGRLSESQSQKNLLSSCLWLKLEKSLYHWSDNIVTHDKVFIGKLSFPFEVIATRTPPPPALLPLYSPFPHTGHFTATHIILDLPFPCSTPKSARPMLPPHTAPPQTPVQNSSALNRGLTLYSKKSPSYRDSNFLFSITIKMSSALCIHHVGFPHSLIIYFHLCSTSQLCTFSNSIPC